MGISESMLAARKAKPIIQTSKKVLPKSPAVKV